MRDKRDEKHSDKETAQLLRKRAKTDAFDNWKKELLKKTEAKPR
jgi:hypothetical protein